MDDAYVVVTFIYDTYTLPNMPSIRTKGIGKTIRITSEAHNMLIELSSSKIETFSDIIMKIGEHYKKTKK